MSCKPHPDPLTPAMDRPLKGAEKTLVDQMIQTIDRPDVLTEKVVVGSKFLAVIAGNRMGLSALLDAVPKQEEIALAQTL
ncbi:MAG: hypothetical protein KKC20_03905, partial [Proteobacteria bacterium]|nr:hypothetical protein [Pseudomonadota bacterium]